MRRPNPYLLITAMFWGYNFLSLKFVFEQMSPPALTFYRFFGVWAVMAILTKSMGQSLSIPREHRSRILWGGCLAMGVYMVFFLEGMARTAAAEGAIILATAPIMTSLLSIWFKQEPFRVERFVGAIIAFIGVAFVILGRGDHEAGQLIGDLIVFISSITWSFSVVVLRPAMKHVDSMPLFTMSLIGAVPVVVLYGLFPQGGKIPIFSVDWVAITPKTWLNFLQVWIGSGAIAFVCYYKGIQQLGAARATMYQYLIPPLATLYSYLLLGRLLMPWQYVGLGIVLTGLVVATKWSAKGSVQTATS